MRGEEPSYAPGRIIEELMLIERAELVVAEISLGFCDTSVQQMEEP